MNMRIYIKDWALIIAALIIASAILFIDPNKPQPLVAIAYITLAIMVAGHYFKGLKDEESKREEERKARKDISDEKPKILNE